MTMESRNSSLNASPAPDTSIVHTYRPAKTHPQIKIEPNCLVFPPPHFGRCIQNAISIYNVSKQPCVFKMRSQNPERYVAKPHVAVVAPESATRIFVTLRDMNTLGLKNLPENTHDRFRISMRLFDPSNVDTTKLSPKELWNVLQERGARVDHEQDLKSYFTKMDTPVGGLITFFPPTYIPVTPTALHRAGGRVTTGATATSAANDSMGQVSSGGNAASHALDSDTDSAAKKTASPSYATAGNNKKDSAGKAEEANKTKLGKPNKMPALWVGVVAAAMVVVSLAVVVGVTLRGRRGGINGNGRGSPSAHDLAAAAATSWEAETALLQQQQQSEVAQSLHAPAEAERLRAAQQEEATVEEWVRVVQSQQQAEETVQALRAQQEAETDAREAAAAAEEQQEATAAESARLQQQWQLEKQQLREAERVQARHVAAQQAEEAERMRLAQEAVERVQAEEALAQRYQAEQASTARVHSEQQQLQQEAQAPVVAQQPHEAVWQGEHRTVEPQ